MKRALFIVLIAFIASACDREEYSRIPHAPVDYELFPEDLHKLAGQPSTLVVTAPRRQSDKIGYGGLLVVHGTEDHYYAFDLSCPVEARREKKLTVEDGVVASCPHCGARFNLLTPDGFPLEGSPYRLTPYQVIISPSLNRVVN